MNLDRKDLGIGGDNYDPFFKYNVTINIFQHIL